MKTVSVILSAPRVILSAAKDLLFFLVLIIPSIASGQATQTIPPNDPVYAFIDRLVAARLVDTVLVGQRMMSRREVGRIIATAHRKLAADTGWMGTRLAEYAAEFPETQSRGPTILSVRGELTGAESPPRGIATDANGAISVDLNPMLGNRLGRPYANGGTQAVSLGATLPLAPWLVVEASGFGSTLDTRGAGSRTHTEFERLYARGLWKNLAAEVGRDHEFFGQGVSAGLLSSSNSPSVDQVRVSSDRPFALPWLLRFAGPMQAAILLGDLGPDQFFPHTRLLAYKASFRPHRRFELGAALTEQVGGEGAPGGTFGQEAVDAFPVIDAVFLHRRTFFSNKFVGLDARYTVPGVSGLQLYMEGMVDDFDLRRFTSAVTEDAGYVWGASTSCLRACGPVRASAEYHVTGLRYYTHGAFQNGYTRNNQFIGDQLGPRGKAGYLFIDADHGPNTFKFDLAYEARSGNKYGSMTTTTDDSDFRFVLLEHHPTERRWRAMPSIRHGLPAATFSYRIGAGVERVENFAHVDGVWRTNWMAQVGAEYRPYRRFWR